MAEKLLEEKLSILTVAVRCSRPHLIRLDGMKKGRAPPKRPIAS